jgi:hypothetical protein
LVSGPIRNAWLSVKRLCSLLDLGAPLLLAAGTPSERNARPRGVMRSVGPSESTSSESASPMSTTPSECKLSKAMRRAISAGVSASTWARCAQR